MMTRENMMDIFDMGNCIEGSLLKRSKYRTDYVVSGEMPMGDMFV